MVTADHGERGGAHGGMLGKGADIYKETLRGVDDGATYPGPTAAYNTF